MKCFIVLALLLTSCNCFAGEVQPDIPLDDACILLEIDRALLNEIPVDAHTTIIIHENGNHTIVRHNLHDEKMIELQQAAKEAVEEIIRQKALQEAETNLRTAMENGQSARQIQQLHDNIMAQLSPIDRLAVEQDMIQIRRMLNREQLLEDGPLWMRKGRQLK